MLFKHVIAATLLRSWDHFTKPYIQGCIDKSDRDPHKHVDSQSLIGLIKHEYKSNKSCKSKEVSNVKEKNGSCNNNANHNSGSSNGCNRNPCDHCNHCGRDRHKTCECHYLNQPKCNECGKYSHKTNDCWDKPSNKCP